MRSAHAVRHRLARAVHDPPSWPLLLAVAGIACVLVLFALARDGYDFRIFYRAGRAVAAGRSPYPPDTAHGLRRDAFVYPRPSAWLFSPLALLSMNAAFTVYTAVSALAVAVGVRLLGGRRMSLVISVGMSAFALRALTLGTVDPLLFLGIACVWRFRNTDHVSGGMLAAGILIKPVIAPVLVFFALTGRVRSIAWAAACGAAIWLVSVGGHAWSQGVRYWQLVSGLTSLEARRSQSPAAGLALHGLSMFEASALIGAIALLLMLGTRMAMGDGERRDRAIFGLALITCVLASPIVWSQYFLLVAAGVVVSDPDAVVIPIVLFCASWFITPDRRWFFSPAAAVAPIGRGGGIGLRRRLCSAV